MIIEYHRPAELNVALELLAREDPPTFPIGGGTRLHQVSNMDFAVVDLQDLSLDGLQLRAKMIEIGAALTLNNLMVHANSGDVDLPDGLLKAIRHEGSYNLRQVATVAGALVSADARSPFGLAMLAMDALLTLQPDDQQITLGDILPFRKEKLRGRLITRVSVPQNLKVAYEFVARSPADWPLVGAALAMWPSGRTRLALCGYGDAPILAFDGGEPTGLEIAAQSAYSHAEDEWASAEYRQEIAGILALRCLGHIQESLK